MPKILIIEDDISFCKLLDKFLTKNAYTVTASYSAAEAKAALTKDNFDLVLTDLRLPDDDGIKLMGEIKI